MNTPFKYIYKSVALAAAATLAFTSCMDKLDELPDNRTQIDSPKKVASLLTSAYPAMTPAVICELSGDNLLDDNVVVPATHNGPYQDFQEEAYQWKDIDNYSLSADDTPYGVWETYYQGISVCNHAIEAMKEMSADPASDTDLAPSWGEAHVLRAYLHFILVNIFSEAYKDDTQSAADRGIPYVTVPETTVRVDYNDSEYTHSVKETYDLIEKDLMEGLPCINDANYRVMAYHFNKNAANAFAARFFLFKRDYEKCLKYSKEALGSSAAAMLRKWGAINDNTAYTKRDSYWDESVTTNFLIQSTYSLQWRMLASTPRFAINDGTTFTKDNQSYTVPSTLGVALYGSGPNWSGSLPCYSARVYINGAGQQYGCYLFRLIEFFEYTDKIAGIGYVHMLYNAFTAEETLLCQAEAKLYSGDREGAIQDLNTWTSSKLITRELDQAAITKWYNRSNASNIYVSCLHPAEMGFQKVLTDPKDIAVLDCILHFRRIETIHCGDRWFDIKRYGISVTHYYRSANEDEIHIDSLTWNDPRRVLQLPKSVRDAGYETNRPAGSSSMGSSSASGTGYQVSVPTDLSNLQIYHPKN